MSLTLHSCTVLRHDLETLKGHLQTNNIVTSQLDADLAEKWLPLVDEIVEKTDALAAAQAQQHHQHHQHQEREAANSLASSAASASLSAKETLLSLLQLESPTAKLHRIGRLLTEISSSEAVPTSTTAAEGGGGGGAPGGTSITKK